MWKVYWAKVEYPYLVSNLVEFELIIHDYTLIHVNWQGKSNQDELGNLPNSSWLDSDQKLLNIQIEVVINRPGKVSI